MLPHSTTQMEFPTYVYSPEQPPIFLNLPASPAVAQLIPLIIATVANNLCAHATYGPFRMFSLNFYGKNSWNNRDFADLVTFVTGYVEVDMAMGQAPNIQMLVGGSIPDAVSLYLTQLLANFPQLRTMIDQQTLNGFSQNAAILQSKMSMIIGFYQRTGINSPILNQGMRQVAPQQQQQVPQGYDPFRQNARGGSASPDRYQQGVMGQQQVFTSSGANPLRQDEHFVGRKYRRENAAPPPPPVIQEHPEVQFKESSVDNWRPTERQPHKTLIDKRYFRKGYYYEDGVTVEFIEPLEEKDMDRSKHSINLLGNTFQMDDVIRKDIVAQQMDNLRSPALVQNTTKEGEAPRPEIVFATAERKVTCDVFLEEAIFQGRKTQRMNAKKGKKCSAYQCFSSVAKPFITRQNNREILKALFSSSRFDEVASYLRMMGNELEKDDGPSLLEEDFDVERERENRKDKQDLAFFLNTINIYLTNFVNEWLQDRASLQHVSIDSFMDDVGSLPQFLLRYGENYVDAFLRFQANSLEYTFVQVSEEAETELAFRLNDGDADLTYTFFTEHYSLAFVDLSSQELGIFLDEKECLLIPELDAPLLFEIAKSLTYVAQNKPFLPRYTLLITEDEKIYRLHKSAVGKDSYLISRHVK